MGCGWKVPFVICLQRFGSIFYQHDLWRPCWYEDQVCLHINKAGSYSSLSLCLIQLDPFISLPTSTAPSQRQSMSLHPVISEPREEWQVEGHHTLWWFTRRVINFGFFRLCKSLRVSTKLRVVGTDFTRTYRLCEGIRFVSSKKRK